MLVSKNSRFLYVLSHVVEGMIEQRQRLLAQSCTSINQATNVRFRDPSNYSPHPAPMTCNPICFWYSVHEKRSHDRRRRKRIMLGYVVHIRSLYWLRGMFVPALERVASGQKAKQRKHHSRHASFRIGTSTQILNSSPIQRFPILPP